MSMLVFLSIAGVSFLILIFSLIFGGDGDLEVDHGFELDSSVVGDFGAGWFNVHVLSIFGTVFGATGAIARAYDVPDLWTYVLAFICGAILAAIVRYLILLLYSQQATSTYSSKSLEGKVGTVTLGILPGKTGQVTLDFGGSYITKSARSQNGEEIKQGESVVVVSTGSPLIVRPNP